MILPANWKIIKNDYSSFQRNSLDKSHLTEDMFMAEYDNFVIDSGWYGDDFEDENGSFITFLIKDNDWEKPILKVNSFELNDIFDIINFCASRVV